MGFRGLGSIVTYWKTMGGKSKNQVRFDLRPLLRGQTGVTKVHFLRKFTFKNLLLKNHTKGSNSESIMAELIKLALRNVNFIQI